MNQGSPAQEMPDNQVAPEHMTFIHQLAEEIVHRGFQGAALFALETGPLFTFLGSQLLWVAQPALSLFIPTAKIEQTATLLESPEATSALITYLQTNQGSRQG